MIMHRLETVLFSNGERFPILVNVKTGNVIKFFERSTTRALAWFPNIDIVSNFEKLLTDEVDLIVISQ